MVTRRIMFFMIITTLICENSFSQNFGIRDTILKLNTFSVVSDRINEFSTGLKVSKLDSNDLRMMKSLSMADVLINLSSSYIKTYGQGSLASISMRGTSITHTGIIWNGFYINSPNLAMNDLSLIPAGFFNNIELQHGGASSLYGNGIIGGSLHFNNSPIYSKQTYVEIGGGIGSFHNYFGNVLVQVSDKKMFSKTGIVYNNAVNDFSYINTAQFGSPKEIQKNAELINYGIIQDISWRLKKNQIISGSFWYQNANRNIPGAMTSVSGNSSQFDYSIRSSLDWKKIEKSYSVLMKSAFIEEYEHYVDTTLIIDSHFKTQSSLNEFECKFNLGYDFKINTGINYSFYQADIQVYKGLKTQNQGGVFLSILKYFKKIDWSVNLNLRQELIKGYEVPFSPSFGLEGKIWKNIGGKINFSKNFRVPTMNDRFWQPGGNERLKPESSLSGEGSLFYKSKKNDKKISSEFIATYYYSLINNWIGWKPTQYGYWGPENLRKVRSSGFEFEGKTKFKYGNFSAVLSEAYTYASSINMDSSSNADESFEKQLIYIPENKAFVQILLLYKGFGISYNHSYTGIRYTNPDNTKFLPNYYVGNIKLEAGIPFKSFNLKAEFHINNLWNTNYQAIEWRPMPQQNYLVKLTLSFKQ